MHNIALPDVMQFDIAIYEEIKSSSCSHVSEYISSLNDSWTIKILRDMTSTNVLQNEIPKYFIHTLINILFVMQLKHWTNY